MKVKIKYLGRTMELFGLSPNQKEETISFHDNSLYKDVLEKIKEKSSEKIEPHIFTLTTEENYKRILRKDHPDCSLDIIDQRKIFEI